MARSKSSRQADVPEKPAAPIARADSEGQVSEPSNLPTAPAWRDPILILQAILAVGVTGVVWQFDPPSRLGLVQTVLIWTVAVAGLLGRWQARLSVRRLDALLTHTKIVTAKLAPDITEEQSGLPMRHVSAWLVAVLGVVASVVLWQFGTVDLMLPGLSTLVVGATVSVMLALSVAANAINRQKTRRLTRDFRAALDSEHLALSTLGSLDVMISACLPTGERTRFNESFLKFLGKTAVQVQGLAWLEVVHPDDRQAVLDMVSRPLSPNARPREQEICVRHRSGDYVWIHETLVPRFSEKGEFIEFIGTAIDISKRVENEATLEKMIGELKNDLTKAQAELTEAKTDLAGAKGELSKTKVSRNRYETTLAESRQEAKTLKEALEKAEANIARIQTQAAERVSVDSTIAKERVKTAEEIAESRLKKLEAAAEGRIAKHEDAVKLARQEVTQGAAENKKLMRAFEKLQTEVGMLRLQDAEMKEQVARQIKESREAREEASSAQTTADALQAQCETLTARCEELTALMAAQDKALGQAQEQAQSASTTAAAEVERRLHEVSGEALATHLRGQLDIVQRTILDLMKTTLDGPVQDAASNTAASIRSMSELVDQALSGAAPRPVARPVSGESFDLRRTAQGVRDLLVADAKARGVRLEVEVPPSMRSVHGDDLEIRAALMSLTGAALELVEDGTLMLRMSEDVTNAAHSTIRCELSHSSARVKNDVLESTLAFKSTEKSMPDAIKHPLAHQAAKAWRTIRRLEGQHGFQLPAEGGFMVWFTFTLPRSAVASQNPLLSSPAPSPPPSPRPPRRGGGIFEALEKQAKSVGSPSPAPAPAPAPTPQAHPIPEATATRPLPRMPQECLTCNLGEVVELGGDTMRVYCAKPPKAGEVTITFNDGAIDGEFNAEVTWSKKIDGKKHDVGLKFLGLTQDEQKRLFKVAIQHRKIASILPEAG